MTRSLRLIHLLCLTGILCLVSTGLAAQSLRAGAATSNITPELGVSIVGGFAPMVATHVHDELHARCLVLDDGNTKLALVVCDILGLRGGVSKEARRLIKEATGIPAENVLISATHTHSAGSALGDSRYEYNAPLNAYQQFLARRIADGVRRADNLLRPAQIAFSSVEAPEHVFNRRWFMREGTAPENPFGKIDKVKMNPPRASANLVEPAGPTDPALSFIALREPEGRLISIFATYSLHYVGGVPASEISADYFAVFSEHLKSLQPDSSGAKDAPFVAMMANGTSGDINNINFREPAQKMTAYEKMNRVGKDLANKVNAAIPALAWKEQAALSASYREITLQRKPLTPELVTWAEKTLSSAPRIKGRVSLPFIYAERVQSLSKLDDKVSVPLQYLRIGEIDIGTSPCETFAETGLEFKKRSQAPHAFMVSLVHDYLGYLPTPRHFELGGYETWPGTNHLEPQASVKILDALLEMEQSL